MKNKLRMALPYGAALVLVLLGACQSAPGSGGTVISRDVLIANQDRQVPATLTLPSGNGPFPLVVFNHGFAGSRQEGGGFAHLADTLAANGIASIRMDFPGCGDSQASFFEYSHRANISDSNACLVWALANAPVDPDRLGLLGYSNGGRMALICSTEQPFPYKAMGLLAPAYFTGTPGQVAEAEERLAIAQAEGSFKMEWYGRTLEVSAKNYIDDLESFEIMKQVKPTVDALIVYGDKDEMVAPSVCLALRDALGAEAVEVPHADHGYGFYSDQPDVTALVEGSFARFFSQKL
ncbi:MAG: alpha/beta hydrolase [Treponema sp.]|nr:alpha/beta hydrolase [Treponema sp.]